MSALKGIWGRAVVRLAVGARKAETTYKWLGLRAHGIWARHARIESWGKRRWAPRPTDAELLALAKRNERRAWDLIWQPTRVADTDTLMRLHSKSVREMVEVRNLIADHPL